MTKYLINILLTAVIAVMSVSCGSSHKTASTGRYPGRGGSATAISPGATGGLDASQRAVIAEAESWLGTPYKYGGNDRNGVDCSGLVLQVYQRALAIDLPRTSRDQRDYCENSKVSGIVPGDLLFFATGKDESRVSHVGIFVGGNNMIHASTSKGVIVSDFTTPYYKRTFAGAGYVGQYRAMLSKKSGDSRTDKPKSKKPGNRKKQAEEPAQEPPVKIAPVESPAGYRFEPVDRLPQRSTPHPDEEAPEQTAVTAVTASSEPVATAEPTPDDARAAVLNSLTEKPLK